MFNSFLYVYQAGYISQKSSLEDDFTNPNHDSRLRENDVFGRDEIYPLVNVYITMENHHFSWENPLFRLGHVQ